MLPRCGSKTPLTRSPVNVSRFRKTLCVLLVALSILNMRHSWRASKQIERNRNRFVEAAWGQCCATSFGRQGSDNHSASDAEHARFARESAANAIESRTYLLTDVCGTFEALTQRIQMYRDVADAKSCSPKHYVDDNDLIALAMYTRRSLYIVFYGNCNVRVICGDAVSAVPDVHQLSAVCFPGSIFIILRRNSQFR